MSPDARLAAAAIGTAAAIGVAIVSSVMVSRPTTGSSVASASPTVPVARATKADPPARAADAPDAGCAPGSMRRMGTDRVAYAATTVRPLIASSTVGSRVGIRFGTRNVNGVAVVFGVLGARVNAACVATHYKVQLPVRPNGSTGWVRASDVTLRTVTTRIVVDLSERRVTLFRGGVAVLLTTAAIGSPATPTPTGRFYVNQRLRASSPIGDFGPGGVGISAFSPVLRNWPQGGPIAIHGTNTPGLIGSAVSHGCLRVRNGDAERLLQLAIEGTPVEIRV